ncbi:FAD binding domain-containing protein [Roseobacter sinensis]|uniref:FAD binding domain-containing protein n=1 Tax=Roseobacter sinensis TaxID=2931391 RepID=A0ABT3BKF2_9RHOB|nr:FAD binding domain-containing protein [Roseobacter sp. WL0113]MCV3273584.1 FAD binding domain-containing protein [Roseobacter sp. WL0113]
MSASYFAPHTLDEAIEVMAAHAPDIVAGGTDYFPSRDRSPLDRSLLDVTRMPELRTISVSDAGWRIGAATTWTDLVRADLPPAFDALRAAAREVGSVQIQNAGTVAGNLCNASPAADGVPPFLVLNAQVELAGPNGRRHLPLAEFLKAPRRTDLQRGEIMVAIHGPPVPQGATSAFEKLGARRYLVISIAMTAVLIVLDDDGLISEARVAVGACSPVAQRLPGLEAALVGQSPDSPGIDADALPELTPISDVRADARYRAEAVPHQIERALQRAARYG